MRKFIFKCGKICLAVVLCVAALTFNGAAQSRSKTKPTEQMAEKIAEAYMAKNLGSLDGRARLLRGRLRVRIEHSISPVRDFESGSFRSFKAVESWLKKREREDGTPFRQVQAFAGCRKGRCRFDEDGGILHNHLYLKRISYDYRNGRLFIKELYFYDGD